MLQRIGAFAAVLVTILVVAACTLPAAPRLGAQNPATSSGPLSSAGANVPLGGGATGTVAGAPGAGGGASGGGGGGAAAQGAGGAGTSGGGAPGAAAGG